MSNQISTFKNFYNKLKPGGLYIVEDIVDVESGKRIYQGMRSISSTLGVALIDLSGVISRPDDIIILACKFDENRKNISNDVITCGGYACELVKCTEDEKGLLQKLGSDAIPLLVSNEWTSFRKQHILENKAKKG